MDKIIKLAVLLREAQDLIDEIKAEQKKTGFEVISAEVNGNSGTASVLMYGAIDKFHVPIKREKHDGENFHCYEDSVVLGGVKFHTYGDDNDAEMVI